MRYALFALLLCANPVFAIDAATLLQVCEDGLRRLDRGDGAEFSVGFCTGYIDGLVEGQNILTRKQWKKWTQDNIRPKGAEVCFPTGTTSRQKIQSIVAYLKEVEANKPMRMFFEANTFVSSALRNRFPCNNS